MIESIHKEDREIVQMVRVVDKVVELGKYHSREENYLKLMTDLYVMHFWERLILRLLMQ